MNAPREETVDDRKERLAATFQAIRAKTNLSMGDLARALGYKGASSIQRYGNPETHTGKYLGHEIITKMLAVLPAKYGVDREMILSLAPPSFNLDGPNATIAPAMELSAGDRLPVYGKAVGGSDGAFLMNGIQIAEVLTPPILQGVPGAYAVYVHGDSMEPRYMDGETCWIHPTRRPIKGNFVVAQIQDDEHEAPHAYVKEFVRHNASGLILRQFNPPKELHFANESVVSVHLVVLAGMS